MSTQPATRQQPQSFKKRVTKTLKSNYLLYLPKDYGQRADKRWPLVLFLHGAGERGNDLDLVKKHGIAKLVDAGKDFPFIAVSPQCPPDHWWASETATLAALLTDLERRYTVDPDRVYVTGLSMGGFGTWALAAEYPHRFAAIAPICGGGEPIWGRRLAHLPIWVFHGAKDQTVPLRRSEDMVEAVKRHGGNPKFTIYPEAGHDSWTETYNNPEFYDWLLSHKRGAK
jgi:predicted peptidase